MTAVLGSERVELTDDEYHLLNQYLEAQFGLSFPPARRAALADRLQPRLRALHLGCFLDYYLILMADRGREREHLAKAVTNNETYFLRERAHFEALFGDGLAHLRRAGSWPRRVRILSAGCSSGEEAYSLSFYAKDLPQLTDLVIDIHAFDLDPDRLEIAARAEYRPRSIRLMTEGQVQRYLEEAGPNRYRVRPRYRAGVRFFPANLVDRDSLGHVAPYDAIFCRNVLIYFSVEALERALINCIDILRVGGLLFLGNCESLIGRAGALETVRIGPCVAYRRVL